MGDPRRRSPRGFTVSQARTYTYSTKRPPPRRANRSGATSTARNATESTILRKFAEYVYVSETGDQRGILAQVVLIAPNLPQLDWRSPRPTTATTAFCKAVRSAAALSCSACDLRPVPCGLLAARQPSRAPPVT